MLFAAKQRLRDLFGLQLTQAPAPDGGKTDKRYLLMPVFENVAHRRCVACREGKRENVAPSLLSSFIYLSISLPLSPHSHSRAMTPPLWRCRSAIQPHASDADAALIGLRAVILAIVTVHAKEGISEGVCL